MKYTFETTKEILFYCILFQIYSFMRSLVQRYPSICSIIDIGLTSEGKPMKLLKVQKLIIILIINRKI